MGLKKCQFCLIFSKLFNFENILPLKFYLPVIFQIIFFIRSEIDYFYTLDPLGACPVNNMVHEIRGALMSTTDHWQRLKLFGEQRFTQGGIFAGGCGIQVQPWRGSMDKELLWSSLSRKNEFLPDLLKAHKCMQLRKKKP